MPRLLAPLLLFVTACTSATPQPNSNTATTRSAARLPAEVVPTHYDLDLTLVPTDDQLSGKVVIDVEVKSNRQELLINAQDITPGVVTVESGGKVMAAKWQETEEGGVVKLLAEGEVVAGPAHISITFTAPWTAGLRGCYKVEDAGDAYIYTQFETSAARSCFPSFDEPAFKTPWDIQLTIPTGQVGVSNSLEVARKELAGGLTQLTFAPTRPLPTYLIAFAVGPMDVVEAPAVPPTPQRSTPLPLRALAGRGKGGDLQASLAAAAEIIRWQEAYFDIAYPYDKLDLIAVQDFEAGAMENAGAITFREYLLLVPEGGPVSPERLRDVVSVTAHEIAHQWFGNLVTMEWWDDIWLNEGFATWMAVRTLQGIRPEWNADVAGQLAVLQAMGNDSLSSARQVAQPIRSGDDIYNAFDGITYDKGGALLAMFERWVSPSSFQAGIRAYLREHAFGTATSSDFVAAINKATGRDLTAAVGSYLLQPGLPFVKVEPGTCTPGQPLSLNLTQARYIPTGVEVASGQTWQIPFCVRHESGGQINETCQLLTTASSTMSLPGCPDWLFPNGAAAGYYRWSLPPVWVNKLSDNLKKLEPIERLMYGDALISGFANSTIQSAEVLGGLALLAGDPLKEISGTPIYFISDIYGRMVEPGLRPALETWAAGVYRPHLAKLGLDEKPGESPDDKLARATLASFLAEVGHDPDVRKGLAERGRAFAGLPGDGQFHPEKVDVALAQLALAIAVEESGPELFDSLYDRLPSITEVERRFQVLKALAYTTDRVRSTKALKLSGSGQLRANELGEVLQTMLNRPETRAFAWKSFQMSLDQQLPYIPEAYLGYLPWSAAGFCSEEAARDVEAFFTPRLPVLPGAPRSLQGVLEVIRSCSVLYNQQRASLAAFLTPSSTPG